MKRWSAAIVAYAGFEFVMGRSVEDLPARSETGWVLVLDARNPDNWTWIGDANWTLG
ncbi:MAG: hypothetical protein JO289_02835 [Xanthobacteraceae bacterium]|nr:hypothetical protein [Xanthobacteraceae bacterium]